MMLKLQVWHHWFSVCPQPLLRLSVSSALLQLFLFPPVPSIDHSMHLMHTSSKKSVFCHEATINQVEVPSDAGLEQTGRTPAHAKMTVARKYKVLQE